jgi:hypothetical protein
VGDFFEWFQILIRKYCCLFSAENFANNKDYNGYHCNNYKDTNTNSALNIPSIMEQLVK